MIKTKGFIWSPRLLDEVYFPFIDDWQLDSESKYYKQFQSDLVFFVAMSARQKQYFDNILKEMELVYNQLKHECSSNK